MKVVNLLLRIALKPYYLLKQRQHKAWKQDRLTSVTTTLTSSGAPLQGYPYIKHGTYNWNGLNYPIDLDLVFHEVPIAIIVTEKYYGTYAYTNIQRDTWEAYMKTTSQAIYACELSRFPLLLITSEDPIDVYSLSIRIGKLIEQK